MIPADLVSQYGLISTQLHSLLDLFLSHLDTDLNEIKPITIDGRIKKPSSVLQKLQTGKYPGVGNVQDIIGLTVVVLHRRQVQQAVEIIKSSGLTVVAEAVREVEATDFRYREPKLFLQPPRDYLVRNPESAGQFLASERVDQVYHHYALLRPGAPISGVEFNQLLQRLRDNGEMLRIFQPYRIKVNAVGQ